MSKTYDWITALQAVHLISREMGGDIPAKLAIAERFRDNALIQTCDWMAEQVDVGGLPGNKPEVSDTRWGTRFANEVFELLEKDPNSIMGGAFTAYSTNWEKDLKRWRWDIGLFVTSRPWIVKGESFKVHWRYKMPARMVAYGMRFDRNSILSIVGRANKPTQISKENSSFSLRSPRKRTVNDAPTRAFFEKLIDNGEMDDIFGPPHAHGVQAHVEAAFHDRVLETTGRTPSESTVRRRVKRLMDLWRRRASANKP